MTNEAAAPVRGTATTAAEAAKPESAGALLRRMRESSGVHLAVLASMMKVAPQKLDALESDRLDQLPDVTFARGLAASICRALGADPKPVLARMPSIAVGLHEPDGAGAGATFQRPGDTPAPLLSSAVSRVVLGIVVVLLLGAGLIWIWPTLPINLNTAQSPAASPNVAEGKALPDDTEVASSAPTADHATSADAASDGKPEAAGASASQTAATSNSIGQPKTVTEPVATAQSATGTTSAPQTGGVTPAAASGSLASSSATAPQGAPAGGAAATTAAAAAQPDTAPAPASADDLSLSASGDSWVEVRDASGKTLLNRTLKAGDKVQLNGDLPFSVVIGRKEAMTVQVHGTPFDLAGLGRGSVARFQVK